MLRLLQVVLMGKGFHLPLPTGFFHIFIPLYHLAALVSRAHQKEGLVYSLDSTS